MLMKAWVPNLGLFATFSVCLKRLLLGWKTYRYLKTLYCMYCDALHDIVLTVNLPEVNTH